MYIDVTAAANTGHDHCWLVQSLPTLLHVYSQLADNSSLPVIVRRSILLAHHPEDGVNGRIASPERTRRSFFTRNDGFRYVAQLDVAHSTWGFDLYDAIRAGLQLRLDKPVALLTLSWCE